jgi:hypothetical protein
MILFSQWGEILRETQINIVSGKIQSQEVHKLETLCGHPQNNLENEHILK